MAALIVAVLRGHAAAELYRIRPLILAGGWSRTLLGDASASSAVLPNSLGPISAGRMWEIYLPTVVKGLTPLWTLLLAIGAAGAWRARAARPGQAHAGAGTTPCVVAGQPGRLGDRPGRAAVGGVGPSSGTTHNVPALRFSPGPDEFGIGRPGAFAPVGLGGRVPENRQPVAERPAAWAPAAVVGAIALAVGSPGIAPAVGKGRAGPLAPQPGGTIAGADRSGRFHPGRQLLCGGGSTFRSWRPPSRKQ